jgi:EAL domain-containing protein (putative c-di-GMP-specific phosphodiesterase class I)
MHVTTALPVGSYSNETKEYNVNAAAVIQTKNCQKKKLCARKSPKALRLASRIEIKAQERLELEQIIVFKQITPVFQPIVSLKNGHIHGYESLSRLTHGGCITNPEELFEKARTHGLTSEIEKLCREKALSRANEVGLEGMIFLNVCPALLHKEGHRPGFTAELLSHLGIEHSRVVFELTEKTLISDYALFERGVAHYRSQGYRIAIDDLGDGYAGLKMLSQVVPDYVKLAQFLVSDIDTSPTRQALAEALVCFSKKIGAQIIAEGIERPEELSYFASLGAEYGQGYLLARPAHLPTLLHTLDLPGIDLSAPPPAHLHCRLSKAACA